MTNFVLNDIMARNAREVTYYEFIKKFAIH